MPDFLKEDGAFSGQKSTPLAFVPPEARAIGLFPAGVFAKPSADCHELDNTSLARWYFRDESILVPATISITPPYSLQGTQAESDIACRAHQASIRLPAEPPLIWTAADSCLDKTRISEDASRLICDSGEIPFRLAERHPLNQAFLDMSSYNWLQARSLFMRGTVNLDMSFVARTLWPLDFKLPEKPPAHPLAAHPLAIRARIREEPSGGARSAFSAETLWQAPDIHAPSPGQPVIAFILNGAQGDDDEAHGGHFAIATGRIGPGGAIHDWLVANFYTLDTESEKGIIAASVPLDNYFADINAGQAWYRPSHILVATLSSEHVATALQSALSSAFRDFYGHRLRYHHATANCAGISVDILRALGWRIPGRGAEGWLNAFGALLLTLARSGSLVQGKLQFDYLTEDRTRLYPAAAFEEIAANLLRLATKDCPPDGLSPFERRLAGDMDSLMLLRIPQFPSSRAWGEHAVVDAQEYRKRLPPRQEDRRIVPVPRRRLPAELAANEASCAGWQRSDYAVIGLGGFIIAVITALLLT
jgi:hypothetical protein